MDSKLRCMFVEGEAGQQTQGEAQASPTTAALVPVLAPVCVCVGVCVFMCVCVSY